MENKQFNEGDKVLLNGNTENIYVISKVIHNYRGNGGCRYHLRKENEEYGSNLSFVRGSKLSAYEEQQPKFKVGQWVRCKKTNNLFEISAFGFAMNKEVAISEIHRTCYILDTLEPYKPKEGEFYCSESAFGHKFITYSDKSKADLYNLNIETGYIEVMWHLHTPTPTNIRPATEEEKQTLIKAVEDEYNKTYCEKTKEWVDMCISVASLDLYCQQARDHNHTIELTLTDGSIVKGDWIGWNKPSRNLIEIGFENQKVVCDDKTVVNFKSYVKPQVNKGTIEVELVVKPIMDFVAEVRNKTEEYANANAERFRQIAEANKEVVELLVKVGVLQDPTNPSDVYSYNVGKSDYAKKSPIQPWMMWQLWDWLTPWDCDIIKRLYRDKEGTSRIEDYNKIIHICKERIRQLNEEK